MGTSVLSFGREDGFNDQGLAVTMSSCGFPVGADKWACSACTGGPAVLGGYPLASGNCRDVGRRSSFKRACPSPVSI